MGFTTALFHGEISQGRGKRNGQVYEDAQFLIANKACGGYRLNLNFAIT